MRGFQDAERSDLPRPKNSTSSFDLDGGAGDSVGKKVLPSGSKDPILAVCQLRSGIRVWCRQNSAQQSSAVADDDATLIMSAVR